MGMSPSGENISDPTNRLGFKSHQGRFVMEVTYEDISLGRQFVCVLHHWKTSESQDDPKHCE